ncbi:hypothetical protein NDU88_001329 [Pleurodeles waltl]|uniref:Uncharacterized protein n=1 Tax=Pleurodeles waltl TaxID=8319 RepID=A0AAV7MPL3_PLEWA|nr:hypothetical protein NDU88_001329 [Pleurodeles waltl]
MKRNPPASKNRRSRVRRGRKGGGATVEVANPTLLLMFKLLGLGGDRLFICSDGISFVLVPLEAMCRAFDRMLGAYYCTCSVTLEGGMGGRQAY